MAKNFNKPGVKNLPEGASSQFHKGQKQWYVFFPYCFNIDGKRFQERDYIGKIVGDEFVPNAYYIDHHPDKDHRPLHRWKHPEKARREREKAEKLKLGEAASKRPVEDYRDGETYEKSVGASALVMKCLYGNGTVRHLGNDALGGDVRMTADTLNVAIHTATTRRPNYLAEDDSFVTKYVGKGCPSSQRISELHTRLGSIPQLEEKLSAGLCSELSKDDLLALDGTKVDCNSKGIDLSALGKRKDGTYGTQITFSTLFNATTGRSLGYRLYAGNLHDVRTLEDYMHLWEAFGVPDTGATVIADRAYYHEDMLAQIGSRGIGFVIGAKTNLNCVREVIKARAEEFRWPENRIANGCSGVSSPITLHSENYTVQGHLFVYLDRNRQVQEVDGFYKSLNDFAEKWRHMPEQDPDLIPKHLREFYISPSPGLPLVIDRYAAIEHGESLGFFAFVSNVVSDVKQCYEYYTYRNEVEVYFKQTRKNGFKSTHVHSDAALKGYALTMFVGTSATMEIMFRKRGKDLDGCSVDEILSKLSKVTLERTAEGEVYLKNVTRKEKELVAKLGFAGLFDSAQEVEKLLSARHLAEYLNKS